MRMLGFPYSFALNHHIEYIYILAPNAASRLFNIPFAAIPHYIMASLSLSWLVADAAVWLMLITNHFTQSYGIHTIYVHTITQTHYAPTPPPVPPSTIWQCSISSSRSICAQVPVVHSWNINVLRIYSYVHVHSAYRRTSFDDGPKCNQPFYRAVVMFAKRIAHARRMHFSSFINSMGRLMDVTQCTRPHAQTDKWTVCSDSSTRACVLWCRGGFAVTGGSMHIPYMND